MHAIAPLANAIVIPHIPEPRRTLRQPDEAQLQADRREAAAGRGWRTIGDRAAAAWRSFVPRLRDYPR